MTIHTLMLTNGAIASVCSLLLNCLLAFLVLKYTPTQMKGYSRLMLMHCFCDVLYDFSQFAIGPLVIPLKGQSFMVIQGLFIGMDGKTTSFLFALSTWIGLTAILLIPIDFFYRYMSVCRNRELSTRSIFIMAILAYLILWIYSFPVKWVSLNSVTGPTPELANYTELIKNVSDWSENVPTYMITIKDSSASSTSSMISTVYILGINLFTILVIVFTSISIHLTIKQKSGFVNNKKTMKIHRQVMKILIIQAALPIVVIIGPIIAILTCALMRISFPLIGLYAAVTTMWFSSIKPIATILIIEKYRKHVMGWLCCSSNYSSQSKTETTSWASSSTKQKPTVAIINGRSSA